ncbi:MAG: SirA family protein [Dehalococcoidia bacterium]|nr:SirA family protein [Dehalococcoidia bacterium]
MTTDAVKVDQELDLRGDVCPYTFVKSKLAIEDMDLGEVLRVIVDHLPAVEAVPKSMQNEGQEVVNVEQINESDWAITLRKQVD